MATEVDRISKVCVCVWRLEVFVHQTIVNVISSKSIHNI